MGGQNSNGPFSIFGCLMHLQHEIAAGQKIPALDDYRVACILKLPRDPFRPLAISFVVADEKVLHLVCANYS